MKIGFVIGLVVLSFFSCHRSNVGNHTLVKKLSTQLDLLADATIDSVKVPRSWEQDKGYLMVGNHNWCCGFPAGSYWYMYELTKEERWEKLAVENTIKLDGFQYYTDTHDLGFMVFCSYGNAYRLTGEEKYKKVILQASESLISRFDSVVGCIRSWDFGSWQFPVIIDNMMNLQMLFWASKVTGDDRFRKVAVSHANTTLKNHFRNDMSSYHVVSYDTISGQAEIRQTHQGYGDESAWARGQAWALYGYTVCFRETGDPDYLNAAEQIAAFIVPDLPDDLIPYWDFDDPAIPDAKRDVSAGAVMASAFYELGKYAKDGKRYFDIADKIMNSLSSEKYLAAIGTNGGFLLKHSVGNMPANSEVDTPLNYADYYYLEALTRWMDLRHWR